MAFFGAKVIQDGGDAAEDLVHAAGVLDGDEVGEFGDAGVATEGFGCCAGAYE